MCNSVSTDATKTVFATSDLLDKALYDIRREILVRVRAMVMSLWVASRTRTVSDALGVMTQSEISMEMFLCGIRNVQCTLYLPSTLKFIVCRAIFAVMISTLPTRT